MDLGWSVFTRPSIISGKPVSSETSRTASPASRSALAVPPVETSSTPCRASACPSSASPVLSETDSKARAIFTSVMSFLHSTVRQEARLSSQLMVMPSAGVSPATTSWSVGCGRASPSIHRLSSTDELPAAAAELPDRAALQAQQRALAVGGAGRPRPRARDGSARRRGRARARFLRPAGISRSSPPSMAAVAGQVEPALVDQAVAADIAVMARLERGRCRRSRRGPSRPRRRPCPAMPSSWIAVELRSPSVSVEWAAVVRSAWHEARRQRALAPRRRRRN